MLETKAYQTIKPLFLMAVGTGKVTHLSVDKAETLCGREGGYGEFSGRFCGNCHKVADKMETAAPAAEEGEIMAKNTKAEEAVEIDNSLADALEPEQAPEAVSPQVAAQIAIMEQITANTERAASLAEAENVDGLAELDKDNETLISSLPQRGKTPNGVTWAKYKQEARNAFRAAAQAKAAPEADAKAAKAAEVEAKAKADAEAADYTKYEGVADRVSAGADLVREGVQGIVKQAQTARKAAEMLLDAQRRISTPNGVPDLLCKSAPAVKARKDMYDRAREVLAAESGDAEHAKSLVTKFGTAVRNQMSDVLRGYIRALDENPEEFREFYGPVAQAHPELSPSDAVFEFYGIPKLSKRELMNQRNAEKAAKLRELEAAASEGDSEAEQAAEELKVQTVHEKIASDLQRGEAAVKSALAAAKELSDEEKQAVKAKIMELVALAAQL